MSQRPHPQPRRRQQQHQSQACYKMGKNVGKLFAAASLWIIVGLAIVFLVPMQSELESVASSTKNDNNIQSIPKSTTTKAESPRLMLQQNTEIFFTKDIQKIQVTPDDDVFIFFDHNDPTLTIEQKQQQDEIEAKLLAAQEAKRKQQEEARKERQKRTIARTITNSNNAQKSVKVRTVIAREKTIKNSNQQQDKEETPQTNKISLQDLRRQNRNQQKAPESDGKVHITAAEQIVIPNPNKQ